jgi:hypothetical protein
MLVKVWRFKIFDHVSGTYTVSSRYSTQEAIARVEGVPILGTETFVESVFLNDEGMTAMGFPQAQGDSG